MSKNHKFYLVKSGRENVYISDSTAYCCNAEGNLSSCNIEVGKWSGKGSWIPEEFLPFCCEQLLREGSEVKVVNFKYVHDLEKHIPSYLGAKELDEYLTAAGM